MVPKVSDFVLHSFVTLPYYPVFLVDLAQMFKLAREAIDFLSEA